jgi:hypothetical protein
VDALARAVVAVLSGTREGGAFEGERALVFEHDSRGRFTRHDHYSVDELDSARARYAELSCEARTPPPIETAATRWIERFVAACETRDLEGLPPALHRDAS